MYVSEQVQLGRQLGDIMGSWRVMSVAERRKYASRAALRNAQRTQEPDPLDILEESMQQISSLGPWGLPSGEYPLGEDQVADKLRQNDAVKFASTAFDRKYGCVVLPDTNFPESVTYDRACGDFLPACRDVIGPPVLARMNNIIEDMIDITAPHGGKVHLGKLYRTRCGPACGLSVTHGSLKLDGWVTYMS